MKLKGKFYENNAISFLSTILYNLKWICLSLIVINLFPVLERGTSSGLDDETCFWGVVLVAVTAFLFICKGQWQNVCDKITDYLAARK